MTPEEAAKYLKLAREIQLGQSIPEQNYSAAPQMSSRAPSPMPGGAPPLPQDVAITEPGGLPTIEPKDQPPGVPAMPVYRAKQQPEQGPQAVQTPSPERAQLPQPDELDQLEKLANQPGPDYLGEAQKAIAARRQAAEAQAAGLDARAEAMYKRAEAADREARGNAQIMAGGMTMLQQPQLAAMYLQQARERPEQEAATGKQKQLMEALRYKQALEQKDLDTLEKAQAQTGSDAAKRSQLLREYIAEKRRAAENADQRARDDRRYGQAESHFQAQQSLERQRIADSQAQREFERARHQSEKDTKLADEFVVHKAAFGPGWIPPKIVSEKTADTLRKAATDIAGLKSAVEGMAELTKDGRNWNYLDSKTRLKISLAAEKLQVAINKLKNPAMEDLGQLTNMDYSALQKQLANPDSFSLRDAPTVNATNRDLVKQFENGIELAKEKAGGKRVTEVAPPGSTVMFNPVTRETASIKNTSVDEARSKGWVIP